MESDYVFVVQLRSAVLICEHYIFSPVTEEPNEILKGAEKSLTNNAIDKNGNTYYYNHYNN